MDFEWDEAKRQANLAKHGLDFADVEEFDWDNPATWPDDRKDYGEERFVAIALFRGRLHSVSYTIRSRFVRVISFRKASRKEALRYEKEKN